MAVDAGVEEATSIDAPSRRLPVSGVPWWLSAMLLAAAGCTPAAPEATPVSEAAEPIALAALPTPEEELAELRALLDELPELFGVERKFGARDPASVLSARLCSFARRHACSPRGLPGWTALQTRAAEILELFAGRGCPETGIVQDVPAQMDRLVLDDILDRREEVREILASVSTEGAHCCEYCGAENRVVVNQRRSEQAERRGDLALARDAQLAAALDTQALCSEPFQAKARREAVDGESWLYLRLGLLLIDTGRPEDGRRLLGAMVQAFPASVAASFAAKELESRGWAEDAGDSRALGAIGVLAVWSVRDPGSVRWLGARRMESAGGPEDLIPATEQESLRIRLVAALTAPEAGASALCLLQGLEGGARPYIEEYLRHASATEWPAGRRLERGDEVLRWLLGGGPDRSDIRGGAAGYSAAWRAWIDEHAADR